MGSSLFAKVKKWSRAEGRVEGEVAAALEHALRRVRGRKTAPSVRGAILEVSERCAALPDLDTRSPEEILGYDERGVFP